MSYRFCLRQRRHDINGSDAYRHLEDVRRCPDCPVEVVMFPEDGEVHHKELQDACSFVKGEIVKVDNPEDCNKKVDGAITDLMGVQHIMAQLHKMGGQSRDYTDNDFKARLEEPDCKAELGRLFVLTDILDKLSENPILRRSVLYKHLENPDNPSQGGKSTKTTWKVKLRYIAFPCVLFFFAFGFQSFMLHMTTHFYVRYMESEAGDNERQESGGQLFDVIGNEFGRYAHNGTYGEGAVTQGAVKIPLPVLDASGAIPLLLCFTAYAASTYYESFNIGLWTKTFLVGSLMAVMKGVFDVVTIMPDSIGWPVCEERLGQVGLERMRNNKFLESFWATVWTAIWQELSPPGGVRVRYCADMMVSGHTYFASLFSLSAYKQVAYNTELFPSAVNKHVRVIVLCLCLCCLVTEFVLVAAARFHYTVDMLIALVLVVLLFDSAHLEQIAADWSEGFQWRDEENFKSRSWFCSKRGDNKESVIPSQSTCFNQRMMAGTVPWKSPEDPCKPHRPVPSYMDSGSGSE